MTTELQQIVDDQLCELITEFEVKDQREFLLELIEWAVFQLKELT